MWISGNEMARQSADDGKGVNRIVNKVALEKRQKRLAEAAKAKKAAKQGG